MKAIEPDNDFINFINPVMKKLIPLFISILAFSSLIAQVGVEAPMTNQPLITKRTASWCPLCGGWGWALFRGLLEDNTENALLVAAHYSGDYLNPAAVAITNNFGGFGQPTFFVNNANQNANSSNGATVRNNVKTLVQAINAQPPVVQAGLRASIDDNYAVEVEAKAKFFEATEGEYYLGAYLIQRNFIAYQAGQGNAAEHKQMLRLSFNGEPFGQLIASGSISAGTEVGLSFNIGYSDWEQAGIVDIDAVYDDNFEVATIIWKKEGDTFQVVNTNATDIDILSGLAEFRQLAVFRAYPTPATEEVTVQLEFSETLSGAQLQLLDVNGALLRTLFTGNFTAGAHTFSLQRAGLPTGQYFLQLSAEGTTTGQPILFK